MVFAPTNQADSDIGHSIPTLALRHCLSFAIVCCVALGLGQAIAGDTTAEASSALMPQTDETRVALIIGNQSYDRSPLKNPAHDAGDLARRLQELGFNVILKQDTSEFGLRSGIEEYAQYLHKGGVGLFFFAGHGVQIKNENYLLPVNVDFESETEIAAKSISAESVLALMTKAGNRANIVILDACRNNPFSTPEGSAGGNLLGQIRPGGGTSAYIAYATVPGTVAHDGDGRNGMFTKHLLKALAEDDLDIESVFRRARQGVLAETGGTQIPTATSYLNEPFSFDPNVHNAPPDPRLCSDAATAWSHLGGSASCADIDAYLKKYPRCPEAANARHRAVAQCTEKNPPPTITPPRPTTPPPPSPAQPTPPPSPVLDPCSEAAASWDRLRSNGSCTDLNAFVSKYDTCAYATIARMRAKSECEESVPPTPIPQPSSTPQTSAPVPQSPLSVPAVPKVSEASMPQSGNEFSDCAQCPKMIVIGPGEFKMGSDGTNPLFASSRPVHRVALATAVTIAKTEVTREQYAAFVKEAQHQPKPAANCFVVRDGTWTIGKATWSNPGFAQDNQHPAVCVSWNDATSYVKWLSKKTNKNYRLPSEAEWEFAARAGDDSTPWSSADQACLFANVADKSLKTILPGHSLFNCSDGYQFTAPAGKYSPNRFGLYDMLGNVAEWVADCWNDTYQGAPVDGAAWTAGDCDSHVIRGTGWDGNPEQVRPDFRDAVGNEFRFQNLGFRVVRTIP